MPDRQWPDVMTVEDAAAYLQLDPSTIRELLRSGMLPGRKVGRVWRLLKFDLDAYLRANQSPLSPDFPTQGESR